MKIETVVWKMNRPLANDYIQAFERVSGLYEYDPKDAEAIRRRAEKLDSAVESRVGREALSSLLAKRNREWGNSEAAEAAAGRLSDVKSLVVAGGQQAGLFTGPMLVMYKAMTIIRQARKAEQLLQRPVVPVFWIAGEDHDFDEVNHVFSLNGEPAIDKLKIDRPSNVRTSVSRTVIEEWESALAQLDASMMQTEFKPAIMERLKRFAAESSTLTDFFARMMAWLFGRYGLVLIDSDDPELRGLEAPMFQRILQDGEPLNDALLQGKHAVEALGYAPQADVYSDGANLFVYAENGERVLLYRREDAFTDRKEDRRYSKEQLLDWCAVSPANFSNNALTRPLMQDFLFPVLGVVLGPGEIAYWALLRQAFRTFGMEMPIIWPRDEYTLIEGTVAKNMGKFGWRPEEVLQRYEDLKRAWLEEQDELKLEEKFANVRDRFLTVYEPLVGSLRSINPGIHKLGETNLQKIMEQISFLEGKAKEASESQFQSTIRQMERIRLSLLPQDKPQERVYNVFAYLNRYGEDWLHTLLTAETPDDGFHRFVYL